MKALDFLIIGAQKCATTALFEHLRRHPGIHMPLEKEVPFFTRDANLSERWDEFASREFGADDGRLRGKATPQYMCDPQAPERIHALMPDTRLIAVLRDPVDRTWSHYQMGLRRETEPRPFETAVADLLNPVALAAARRQGPPEHRDGYVSESDFYVAWSEYGRILRRYVELFGRDQILVLYAEDLKQNPGPTLDRILTFIGLPAGFRPTTLGQIVHRGGGSNRIPHGVRNWLRDRKVLRWLWELVPENRRGRLRFVYEQWNTKPPEPGRPIASEVIAALRQHYARDLKLLTQLALPEPPWADRYADEGA